MMVTFAFAATVINYLDRQVLSITAPILKDEFRMSDESYGLVLAAFMLAYAVMNGLSGPFIDRVGSRVGYACCMAWWSTPESCTCRPRSVVAGDVPLLSRRGRGGELARRREARERMVSGARARARLGDFQQRRGDRRRGGAAGDRPDRVGLGLQEPSC
ncbi:MAG: MFS transporter [Lacunisphaera sp.]